MEDDMKRSTFLTGLTLLIVMGTLAMGVVPARPAAKAADSVKLTFWNYWDGKNGEVIQALVDRYNQENPDVTIENVFIGWGELLPKLQLAVAGGDTPDLAAADMAWMPYLAHSSALLPLNSLIETSGIDQNDFYPALMAVNTYGDQIFGLPVSTNNLELFINNDLFKAAGLDPAQPPTTWDELKDAAVKCANPDKGIVGMELYTQPGEGLTWQFQVYLWQAGGDFLNKDLTAAAFNSEAGTQALQFWMDLIQSGAYTLSDWGSFEQGNACMRMDGSWMVGILAENAPFEFSVAKMPYPADGQPATNMGGEHIFIMAKDEASQQAAWDFITWFTSPDIQVEWDTQTGFMPIRNSVATDETYLTWLNDNEPRLIPFVEMQQYAHNRPPVEKYAELSDAFSKALERALYGEASVEGALKEAETAVNDILGS
jgi:multiple sugar transport system substrate-binding protein